MRHLTVLNFRQLSSGLIEPFHLIFMNLILALLTALAKGEVPSNIGNSLELTQFWTQEIYFTLRNVPKSHLSNFVCPLVFIWIHFRLANIPVLNWYLFTKYFINYDNCNNKWEVLSSGIWRSVARWKLINVSEEYTVTLLGSKNKANKKSSWRR
jgi:hypothetical protein